MNFLDPLDIIKKPESSNNAVVFVIDCSIGDNDIIVYELQSVQASLLTNRHGEYLANDEMNCSLDHSGFKKNHGVYLISHDNQKVIARPEGESINPWFLSAKEGQKAPELEETLKDIKEIYFCIYTAFQQNAFLNKSYQILFFTQHCPELFPFSRVYSRNMEIEKVVSDIKKYFSNKESEEVVIKAPFTANGRGNYFGLTVESSKEEFKEAVQAVLEASDTHLFLSLSSIGRKLGITEFEFFRTEVKKKLEQLGYYKDFSFDFLVQEQKHYERSKRADKIEKKGFNTYRLLVLASKDGKYFHVTPIRKYQSQTVDSHQFTKETNYSEKKKKIDFSPSVYKKIQHLTQAVFEYDKIITEKDPRELDEYLKKLNECNKAPQEKPLKTSLEKSFFELIDNNAYTFDKFLRLFFKSSSKDPSFINFFSTFVLDDAAILQADLLAVLFKYLSKEELNAFINKQGGVVSLLGKKALNIETLKNLCELKLIDIVSLMKDAEIKKLVSNLILKDAYSLYKFFTNLSPDIIEEAIKNIDFTELKFTDHSFMVLFDDLPIKYRQPLIKAIGASKILKDVQEGKNTYYINGHIDSKTSWELVISIAQEERNKISRTSFFSQQEIKRNTNDGEGVVLKNVSNVPRP